MYIIYMATLTLYQMPPGKEKKSQKIFEENKCEHNFSLMRESTF